METSQADAGQKHERRSTDLGVKLRGTSDDESEAF